MAATIAANEGKFHQRSLRIGGAGNVSMKWNVEDVDKVTAEYVSLQNLSRF